MTTVPSALRADALGKSYQSVEALQELSLSIESGVTAVLGQNGAGKTTLIKCALGLETPTAGSIAIFGGSPASRATRQRVGVMLQDTDLPELLTARELLELFASYYEAPLPSGAVVELAQISEFVDKRYGKLSGGQKRRVQFALAIIGNPDLVFLDEPTTGLDTDARKTLWAVVRGIAKSGRSIVLTTHYLEEADALADRIIILADGRVIADGPAHEIRKGVSGSTIRCETRLTAADIEVLPGCSHVRQSGRMTEIRTNNAVATLRVLLQRDDSLCDLSVTEPRLEEIFEELTR